MSHALQADTRGARAFHFTIHSRSTGRTLGIAVVVPKGADDQRRPLLVYLHGRNGDENSELRNDAMYKGLSRAGRRAPIIAFPDGGRDKYWHDRRSGGWGRWVIDEVIPAVTRRTGADSKRVAIGGISMGGFGALDLARLHPSRFCAVGAHSPAIWQTGGQTAAGAFDDAQDFGRHDVVGAARARHISFGHAALWIDAGRSDPFQPGDRALVNALHGAGVPVRANLRSPGGHDRAYWHRHWPQYLAFYARALADCR